jgi:hypothetical protein
MRVPLLVVLVLIVLCWVSRWCGWCRGYGRRQGERGLFSFSQRLQLGGNSPIGDSWCSGWLRGSRQESISLDIIISSCKLPLFPLLNSILNIILQYRWCQLIDALAAPPELARIVVYPSPGFTSRQDLQTLRLLARRSPQWT